MSVVQRITLIFRIVVTIQEDDIFPYRSDKDDDSPSIATLASFSSGSAQLFRDKSVPQGIETMDLREPDGSKNDVRK